MNKPVLLIILMAIFTACNTSKQQQTITSTGDLPSVETKAPNSPQYKAAYMGQTRIGGIKTKTLLEVSILTDKLVRPWAVVSMPDGRFLITEKRGTFRIATNMGKITEPINGALPVDDAGQGGLLDVALDPDFKNNRMIYWAFSEPVDGGNHTAVAKGRLANDERTIENAKVIYRAIPTFKGRLHYGSRLAFDENGYLYVSTGERSDLATRPKAQELSAALGKILRITKDGSPAPGNPFINTSGALPEIWSYGHRTPQGLVFHPVTGELWESEMGPRGGDEINLIKAGKNYGWPIITYGIEYSGKTIGDGITQKQGMEQPVYYWDPVQSPSGITFYSKGLITEWDNNLFVGGLSSKHIARLMINNNKIVGEERLLEDQNQRFRDVEQGKDGALYAVTDEGRLYRISSK
ncbi:MAG: PQQ-dependent sugar dehydrogenase [Niabella sp.]